MEMIVCSFTGLMQHTSFRVKSLDFNIDKIAIIIQRHNGYDCHDRMKTKNWRNVSIIYADKAQSFQTINVAVNSDLQLNSTLSKSKFSFIHSLRHKCYLFLFFYIFIIKGIKNRFNSVIFLSFYLQINLNLD